MLLSELYSVGVTVVIAFIQRWIFLHNRPFNHTLWLIIWFALFVPLWWLSGKNPIAMVAAVLIKFILFDPLLNLIRGLPFWYTSDWGDDSKTDDWKERHRSLTKIFYFAAVAGLVTINIIAFA